MNLDDIEAKAKAALVGCGNADWDYQDATSPDVVLAMVAEIRRLREALEEVVGSACSCAGCASEEPEAIAIARAALDQCLEPAQGDE